MGGGLTNCWLWIDLSLCQNLIHIGCQIQMLHERSFAKDLWWFSVLQVRLQLTSSPFFASLHQNFFKVSQQLWLGNVTLWLEKAFVFDHVDDVFWYIILWYHPVNWYEFIWKLHGLNCFYMICFFDLSFEETVEAPPLGHLLNVVFIICLAKIDPVLFTWSNRSVFFILFPSNNHPHWVKHWYHHNKLYERMSKCTSNENELNLELVIFWESATRLHCRGETKWWHSFTNTRIIQIQHESPTHFFFFFTGNWNFPIFPVKLSRIFQLDVCSFGIAKYLPRLD